jgi:hypothetical protein
MEVILKVHSKMVYVQVKVYGKKDQEIVINIKANI